MAQFGGLSSVTKWGRVQNILLELHTPQNNDTDTQVASSRESLLQNYEPSCDEDMTCENNTDNNIDLDNDIDDDDRFTDCLSNFSEEEDFFSDTYDTSNFDDLPDKLHQWVVESGVTQNAADSQLKILNKHIPSHPKCSRTLMKTSHSHKVKTIDGGEYVHFGILEHLLQNRDGLLSQTDTIKLQVNIDGLPLFKSSQMQLWPILGKFPFESNPFVIGVFCETENHTIQISILKNLLRRFPV